MESNTVRFYLVLDLRSHKENLYKIYFRFIHNRKKKDYFTGIRWDKDKFDKNNEILLPRYPGDPDVEKNNAIINQMKSKLNRLNVLSYAKDIPYTIDDYINVLKHKASYENFITFMRVQIRNEHLKGVIAYQTYIKHNSVLNNIIEYFGETLPISMIDVEAIQSFEGYYRKIGRKHNTIVAYHKVFAKYLGIAVEKGYIDENPYDKIKYRFVPGQRVALTRDEVKKLYQAFEDRILPPVEHEVLRRFLFSCITGVRISDTHKLTYKHINNDKLSFAPTKTKKLNKVVTIPLPKIALKLVENREGKLFIPFSDQGINRILKRIAQMVGINEEITFHSARDTFGTIFIELGGDIKSLCDLMGHSSTKVTEIYLKMADNRKKELMNNFDSLF